MSKQQTIKESSISSTEDIITLIEFQQKLLNLVHTQLYSHQTVDENALVKFQINYVSEMNESWKKMVEDLNFRLVKQRIPYQSSLRDQFHKVLSVDYLPFLRINKHQLTQVSLYGFDIYVQPLSAMLEIINRIDGQVHILNKHSINNQQQLLWADKPKDIWEAVQRGWNYFIYQSSLCKLSLNIYILCQYLKIAAKSLVKKDKQIIFTGCYNLFSSIVPILKANRQIWLLCEFSDLNNELYQFHPSFNYSHFYSLMLPLLNQYQPVFRGIKFIGQKCLGTNILTPLLFAVLRHRQSFHQFIDQTDDKCWAPYLNGLVFGLIYNFKARILEYEQSMEILKCAILKLGVFGTLETSYFTGQLGKQWNEARDFFISALKVGYNVGQLQTWHPIDFPTIQQKIINYSKNSLLMHPQLPTKIPTKLFFPNGFEKQLQDCLQQLTGSLLNKQQLTTNFSPNIAQTVTINENSVFSILKLSLLVKQCKLTKNIHCLCYILSFLNKIQNIQSQILIQRLTELGDSYCEVAIKQLQKQQKNREDLKQVLFAYIKKNRPLAKIDQIIRVCLMISTPKQATLQILAILQTAGEGHNLCQIAAANILSMFSPQKLDGDVKVKTFQKQYSIQNQVINMNSKLHSCINLLVQNIIEKDSGRTIQTLMWMCRMSSWIVIPLLSSPVSSRFDRNDPNKKLQSFGMWLIGNPRFHSLLLELLSLGFSQNNRQIKTYFMEICLVGVCDQIIMEINRVLNQLDQVEDNQIYKYVLQLLELLTLTYRQSTGSLNIQLVQKIVKLYLRSLLKINVTISNIQDQNATKQIIISLKQLYCPLIDYIFKTNNINSRKWRTCMRKICLTSLDINVQHVSNVRDFQLPSIRKDKGFLITNPVEVTKEQDLTIMVDRLKTRADSFYQQAQRYNPNNVFQRKDKPQQKPQYLLSPVEIRELKLSQIGDIMYSKQYLLPALSLKTIKQLLTHCKQVDFPLIVDLLAMTPSNHRKLTEWALLNKNTEVIRRIGLSKQTVAGLLSQILIVFQNEDKSGLVAGLDQASRKTISDNLNLMMMRQQMQGNKDKQLISDLSKDLGFLLVLNQSNWRYANQLINQLASSKMSGLASTPSLLLQYLQYIRITSNPNQDYEQKVHAYLQMLQTYQHLLQQKQQYLGKLGDQPKQGDKDQKMSQEQIRLFKVNELGYIGTICQSWCAKDFLHRAAHLRAEITQLTTDVAKFQHIFKLIDSTVSCLTSINIIINNIAKGHVVSPDFLSSYRMCSNSAYNLYKITLGENIQTYYRSILKFDQHLYTYLPCEHPIQVKQYLPVAVPNIADAKEVPESVKVHIKNILEQNTKKVISQKYQLLYKYLIQHKIITVGSDKLSIELVRNQTQNQNQSDQSSKSTYNKYLFYFGILVKAIQLTNQKKIKFDRLLEALTQRQALTWELLKDYDAQAYHHIKSVVIDEQIQTRKLKFMFKEKPLLPQGPNIEVNKLNCNRYCNLLAKAAVGIDTLQKANFLVQGFNCIN